MGAEWGLNLTICQIHADRQPTDQELLHEFLRRIGLNIAIVQFLNWWALEVERIKNNDSDYAGPPITAQQPTWATQCISVYDYLQEY